MPRVASVQFFDYSHALEYNHKSGISFLPCGNVVTHHTEVWRVCIVYFCEVFPLDALPVKLFAAHCYCGESAVEEASCETTWDCWTVHLVVEVSRWAAHMACGQILKAGIQRHFGLVKPPMREDDGWGAGGVGHFVIIECQGFVEWRGWPGKDCTAAPL